jgi:membrane associated rhomboid family serine protease
LIPLRDINPTRRAPLVTYWIIALNFAVFVYEFLLLSPLERAVFERTHAVIPMFLFSGYAPSLSTVFSSMFMHGNLVHLLSNMWFLHIFGDNVEDAMGHLRYAIFYVFCGVLAALVHAASDPGSQSQMVGASGAICGVLGAYMLLFPRARLVTWLLLLFEMPALVYIGGYFALQVYSGFSSLGHPRAAGVAFFAHVGGFVAGIGWVLLLGRPPPDPDTYLGPRLSDRNLRRRL